jgi:hypothetical protein
VITTTLNTNVSAIAQKWLLEFQLMDEDEVCVDPLLTVKYQETNFDADDEYFDVSVLFLENGARNTTIDDYYSNDFQIELASDCGYHEEQCLLFNYCGLLKDYPLSAVEIGSITFDDLLIVIIDVSENVDLLDCDYSFFANVTLTCTQSSAPTPQTLPPTTFAPTTRNMTRNPTPRPTNYGFCFVLCDT